MELGQPKFGRGNPLLERINDMRSRAGMGPLDNAPEEPQVEILDARRSQPFGMGFAVGDTDIDGCVSKYTNEGNTPESAEAHCIASAYLDECLSNAEDSDGGPGHDAERDCRDSHDVPPLVKEEPEAREPLDPNRRPPACSKQAFYDKGGFTFWGLLAPLPYAGYQAYKRAARQATCTLPTNGGQASRVNPECKALAVESATHQRCYGESLEGTPVGTLKMMVRRQPWGFPLAVIGGIVGGYHGYKKQDGWKTTAGWSAAGLLFPLVIGGVAAWQGFPLYKKK